ncbi:hypothetical protein [uncultured Acetobacteroides sp.]|uniref:hypothetical protein n=1 Tax=uncultured Acetobacteroides sp. TaxID=1760811 RepID=UPI0029F54474|nr:hypothetical protein [uncultured Acetobacteroides sp.]
MSKTDYDLLAAEIEKVQNAATPNMPISVMLQEAENLEHWVQEDKVLLTAVGLDWKVVDSISPRAGALRYLQGEWNKEFQSKDEAQKEWNLRSPEAYALHDELIHHGLFAYRNMPDVLTKVQRIADGSGHADMIQDLTDLCALGKAYPAPLTAIGVDLKLFDKAGVLSEEMADLLARANGSRMHSNVTVQTRNKAYIHLKEAMDEVRRCGQYAFWRNEERKRGYVSQYMKVKVAKSKAKTSEE